MTKKLRAPRNRTLILSDHERRHYAKLLQGFPKSSKTPARNFPEGVFNDNLQDCIEYLPQSSVDLLFLDPPYNLSKDYGVVQFQKKGMAEYEAWFRSWFEPLLRVLKPTASVYVCGDWLTSVSIFNVLSDHLYVRNRITWEREKGRGAKSNWKNSSEDIWFATVDRDKFTFNVDSVKLKRKVNAPYRDSAREPKDWEKSTGGNFRLTYPSNLWTDISVPFWSMPENTDHPTQKPEKLVAKLILASTAPGDLVLDPFLGSGTTAVVAKKLQRRFLGIEINPEFCMWALKRIDKSLTESSIQGYSDGVFWERNAFAEILASQSSRSDK